MSKEVFISYASEDRTAAEQICSGLESNGINCWMAPRDILPGMVYAEAIIQAIDRSKIMILMFSSHSNNSPHVVREVERAVHGNSIVIPVRLEKAALSPSLEYYISAPHWIDATDGNLDIHIGKLTSTIEEYLGTKPAVTDAKPVITSPQEKDTTPMGPEIESEKMEYPIQFRYLGYLSFLLAGWFFLIAVYSTQIVNLNSSSVTYLTVIRNSTYIPTILGFVMIFTGYILIKNISVEKLKILNIILPISFVLVIIQSFIVNSIIPLIPILIIYIPFLIFYLKFSQNST